VGSRKRVKRPPAEREKPIRNRVTGDPSVAPGNGDAGAAIADGLAAGRRVIEVAGASAMDAVEAGVQTAYTVCEEYLARGREEAVRQQARSGLMEPPNRDRTFDAWSQAMGPMSPMFAPWMQMMKMWTDGMTMWAPAWGAMAQQWTSPAAWADGNPFNAPPVTVALTSKTPVDVTVELKPGAQLRRLTVSPLRHASDGDAPPLAGIEIDCKPDRARLSVSIPKDQPAGSYSGKVVDSVGLEQGYVRVDVPEKTTARKAAKKKAAKKKAAKKS
jgi:hypothetical protein